MSDDQIIIGLSTLVVFGLGAQWIGRRTGIPSLLLLLPAGLLAGDVWGLVEPEELFGDILGPLVTLLVSLLLFQSGNQLRLADLPARAGRSVVRLVTIGLAVTYLGASAAAMLFLDVPRQLAFMTGAIVVVSGPTVVGPLLDVVRPRQPTGTVLRWEGTVLDPIGATLGVVVLNLVLATDRGGVHPVLQMLGRLGVGVGIGLLAAALLVVVISRFWVTDEMEAGVALLFAVGAFAAAEVLLSEAGLFATVTMGVVVANQRVVSTRRISGFGETLEVLIIGILFVLLGALVEVDELVDQAGAILLIVAALVVVVRPLTAAISLVGTPLGARDRAMVGWMDPRGIVAAATATQFAASLSAAGFDVGFLLPVTFGVILGTGLVYGLTARPVARILGVAEPPRTGVVLVGDDEWLDGLGQGLVDAGVPTLRVTTLPGGGDAPVSGPGGGPATASLAEGTAAVREAIEDAGLARALFSVAPDSPLTLLEPDLLELLGRRHVLRVPRRRPEGVAATLAERFATDAFADTATRADLAERCAAGSVVRRLDGPPAPDVVVLAAVGPDGHVEMRDPASAAGNDVVLLGLVPGPDAPASAG